MEGQFDWAKQHNKPIGFRVILENPDSPEPGMPEFLLAKVPYVKLKGEWKEIPRRCVTGKITKCHAMTIRHTRLHSAS